MKHDYRGQQPSYGAECYVAPGARLVGDVSLGNQTSVWFNSVVRADVAPIRIGARTNLQDQAVVHVRRDQPTKIGDRVTVGHGAKLHACRIEDCALIGIGSIVLDGATIGSETMIGAGSLVPPDRSIPPGHLAMGSPAEIKRELTEEERIEIKDSAERYVDYAKEHRDSGDDLR